MATNGATPYWSCQNFENTYGDPPHSPPVLNIKSGEPCLNTGSQADVRSGPKQKPSSAPPMSAVPPRADASRSIANVSYGPGADSCQREQMRGPNPTSEHSTFCGFRSKRGLIVDQLQQIVGANRLDENSKIMRGDRLAYVRPCIAR
jgi:hypothetical protein